jgi:predicted lipoprotein with Yx(FWY)xxD motif
VATSATALVGGLHAAETKLGTVLVDADGFTLYVLLSDGPGSSSCVDACAAAWPPHAPDDAGTVGDGVDATAVAEIVRSDGSAQATYHGKPLYRYAGDAAAGDLNGLGIEDVWFVVAPDGTAIGAPEPDDIDYGGYGY